MPASPKKNRMMPESVCFDEFFIIKKKSGTEVPLLYIKLKLVVEVNVSSRFLALFGESNVWFEGDGYAILDAGAHHHCAVAGVYLQVMYLAPI